MPWSGPLRDVGQWLHDRPTAFLCLAGILLPNLLSLLALPFDIGVPPRTSAIFLYMSVALAARSLSFPFVAMSFAVALAYDAVSTVATLFNLAPTEMTAAIRFAGTVRLFDSPLYVGLAFGALIPAAGAVGLLAWRANARRANPWIFVAAVTATAAIDFTLHVSPHYHFGSMMGQGRPVQSAAETSAFGRLAGTGGRNAIVVVVESMGQLVDAEKRAWIAAPLMAPEVAARYQVTSGATEYFGSTTAGEMRELCGTRAGYAELDAAAAARCLPARLKRAGYETIALHGFSRNMFERRDWYPKIGFDRMVFGEDLKAAGIRMCGGPFRGACDADMEPVIRRTIDAAERPYLVYWLTLNTHVPVLPADVRGPLACADGAAGDSRNVCVMAALWREVFASVARLAVHAASKPTDILIVGDHAPPLWSASGRAMFEPGKVAWYRLSPR